MKRTRPGTGTDSVQNKQPGNLYTFGWDSPEEVKCYFYTDELFQNIKNLSNLRKKFDFLKNEK